MSAGRKVRRHPSRRLVVRRHPVRAARRGASVRRRQPEAAPGEGQTGRLPHSTLRPSRLPEPAAGHDRGQPGQETDGESNIDKYR